MLQPFDLGDLRLPNRVVMAPATRARATNADLVPTDLHAAYYGQRATAGLIVAEATWVSEQAIGIPNVPGICSPHQVDGWSQVTSAVHALGGRIFLQLWHAGDLPTGASETPEMGITEIEAAITAYGVAAEQARRAGFDGVEIAANGTYLIAQSLNLRLNRRTDRYGIDRHRLLLEIIDAATAAWNGQRVGVRLSPYWTVVDRSRSGQPGSDHDYPYTADQATLADYDRLVTSLSERRIGYVHIRGRAPSEPGGVPDFDAIARYRKLFDGPLVANHGFERETGNAIIEAGIADAVSSAQLFIANPDLVSRIALGHDIATPDPTTFYVGGPCGYLDYPLWTGPPAA